MKVSHYWFALLLPFFNTHSTFAQCVWTESTPAPTERMEAGNAVIDGKLYVFGGFESGIDASLRVDVFDPVAETWDSVSTMPSPITHIIANRYGRSIWLVGGFLGDDPGVATDEVWVYNVDSSTWRMGPTLPAERAAGFSAVIGSKLHYSGGLWADRETPSFDHWVLDLENESAGWQSAAPPIDGFNHGSALAIGGKMYTFGGQYGHDGVTDDQAITDVYDPKTDSWTRLSNGLKDRSHQEPNTFFIDGYVYVCGGRNGSEIYNDIDAYDLATDTWADFCQLSSRWLAPNVKPINGQLIHTQGGQWGSGVLRNGVRMSPFNPTPDRRLAFTDDTLRVSLDAAESASLETLLWSAGDHTAYTLGTLPSWLSASGRFSEVDHSGVDILLQINTAGLLAGVYSTTLTALAPGYTSAELVLELTVNPSTECVLAPDSLASVVLGSSVSLSWQSIPNALGYQVTGQEISGATSGSFKTTLTSANLTLPAAAYRWRVRAKCLSGAISPFSTVADFTIAALRTEDASMALPPITVFPNPAQESVCFSTALLPDPGLELEWIALDGRTVKTDRLVSSGCVQTPDVDGLYVVRFQDGQVVRVLVDRLATSAP